MNPTAGSARAAGRARKALEHLTATGVEVQIHETKHPGHATQLARQAVEAGNLDLAAVGGDGTAFEVLNGIPKIASPIRLAILPFGTGNSLMNDLAEDGSATVLDAIEHQRTRRIDVLELQALDPEGEPWKCRLLGNVSFGFPALVVDQTYRHFKRLGALGYTLGFLAALSNYAPIELAVRSKGVRYQTDTRSHFAFVAINNNPTFGGNMRFAPDAQVDDGLADIFLIDPVGRFDLASTFPRIFRGTHVSHPAVHFHLAKEVHFESQGPVEVLIDGELFRLEPKSLEVRHQALELFL